MKNRKTTRIIIIVLCLFLAVFAGILQAKSLKTAERFSVDRFFGEGGE